ncbi:MAG: hypothetical protein AAGA10_30085 [Bacteroidota bacterium]
MKRIFTSYTSLFFAIFLVTGMEAFSQATIGFYARHRPDDATLNAPAYRQAWGGSLEIMSPNLRTGNGIQWMLGGSLNIMHAGRERVDVNPEVLDELDEHWVVNNLQFGIDGISRFMAPSSWRVQPYVDFMAGLGVFAVEEVLQYNDVESDCETYDGRVATANWKLQTGAGLGMMIQVTDGVNIDLRGTYAPTRNVRHANLESVEIQDFNLQYDMMRSTLNPWTFHVGVQMRIEDIDCAPGRGEISEAENWEE